MANIVLFKPRREVGAQANLRALIAHGRDRLTIFGKDLEFDKNSWDVTAFIPLKGKNGALRAVFSSWATANEPVPAPMPQPFLSFAKVYFRYQHGLRPVKAVGFRISALRALCAALEEHGSADPTAADAGVFNRASQLLASHYSEGAGYRIGMQLEMLARFLDDNHLTTTPLQWKCPQPRPTDMWGRVGEEFDRRRKDKLPSPNALDCLARAFIAATEPRDVVITSIAAIFCSAPDRVNEVLSLRSDCEVKEVQRGGRTAYGLRYWTSKGAEPMVKWVVPSMAGVVAEAIKRLRQCTQEARAVAAWYAAHPTSLFLPPHLEYLRGSTSLSMLEVMEILFVEPALGGAAWCKRNGVRVRGRGRKLFAAFEDLERAVVAKLPRGFPVMEREVGLQYSEALCVMLRNSLHGQRGTYRCLIEAVDQGAVSAGLGNRSEHGVSSVFDRLGFFEVDGTPIAIRSHQFRHYLDTLAHAGGMSELDIAKWSGRLDVRQNSAYNHVSDRDVLARLEELKAQDPQVTSLPAVQPRVSLLPRAKFAELKISAAHPTDFGFCVHDYAMSPCQLHLDCLNCNEHVCVKGDEIGERNLRIQLEETTSLLKEAQAAEAAGLYGASRWVQHQQRVLERLVQLKDIVDNVDVQRGAVIHLAHINPASRLQQAIEDRKSLPQHHIDRSRLCWRADGKGSSA